MYLPLYKVADTPFHIQGDGILAYTVPVALGLNVLIPRFVPVEAKDLP